MNRLSALQPPLPTDASRRIVWKRLYGSSKALAIAQSIKTWPGNVLVLTPDTLTSERLRSELSFFLEDACPLLEFPHWETLPYDHFSPYQSIVSDRLACLSELRKGQRSVVLTAVPTAMYRLAPVEFVDAHTLVFKVGESLPRDTFRQRLEEAGYRCVSQVVEHGDYAIRGSLIDVFPMGRQRPVRLDLFDEDIESIRLFDAETQRSAGELQEVRILPAKEFLLDEAGIRRFRAGWRRQFEGNPTRINTYTDISNGLAPAGIEAYLPLFFAETHSLFDYLSAATLVICDEHTEATAQTFWEQIQNRYESLRHDVEHPCLPPDAVFFAPAQIISAIGGFPAVSIAGTGEVSDEAHDFATSVPMQLPIDARSSDPMAIVKRFLNEFSGRVLFSAYSKGRRETLLELFQRHRLEVHMFDGWSDFLHGDHRHGLCVADIDQGAQLEAPALALVSEGQLFGERVRQRRRRRPQRDPDTLIASLTELAEGAPVVHEEHGVGRYQGLTTLTIDEIPGEYLCLRYADDDKLYVPVSNLHLISRYSGVDPEHAPLHKLGSGAWQKARQRAAQRAQDVAAELLDIHARRAARQGTAYPLEAETYRAFCEGFPFEETVDQAEAIEAVCKDLVSQKPMDRLVCGDVGFGKTEVAMRAAFVVANSGHQVAILVPTTLLAQQHYQTFSDRFADWPMRIEHLSRFRSRKEQEAILKSLRDGTVDIVIGTHKLLQSDIDFKRLGLLIIDEEHRFGVRQKERLKALRSEVDILVLTATPIPRTLNMALASCRDLSIIATPPAKRLAIKTFVSERRDGVLREAVLREIARGGQVYFLHNDVDTIQRTAKELEALVPEARVRFAHGQMRERDLERVMSDFYHRRFNVLVCTTIIETGIDVPSANTIIINRADRFGLAQLYQLRGRVGRSHHRAYAYLLIPSRKAVSKDALKRLEAIEALEDLGIGFTLATHDLEIRGAGEILGDEQSGHIQEIGFGLYNELLRRAVTALRAGRSPTLDRPLDHGVEIRMGLPALIPADYIPDVHMRLMLYKQIASAADKDELTALREEVIDRFGALPEPAKALFRLTEMKLIAEPLSIRKIDVTRNGIRLAFSEHPNIDAGKVIALVQARPERYRLEGNEKLRLVADMPEGPARFPVLEEFLNELIEVQRDAA